MGTITGNGTAVTGLGGAEGYGETALVRGDDGFTKVDVSAVFEAGFDIGGTRYDGDQLYISNDGFVTFGAGVGTIPGNPGTLTVPFLAIFMADVDTRLDGEGAESGQIWLDIDPVQDCVTITWDDVGFYRRNASETNTFQMQLFDRGAGTMDVVYRYEDIDWTTGDLQGGWGGLGGNPAFIGYRMDEAGAAVAIAPSRNETSQLALPGAFGNTGVQGMWVFRLGGAVAPVPITGGAGSDTLQGTSGVDTLRGMAGDDRLIGSNGADQMDGGTGWDAVDFSVAPAAVRIDRLTASANTGWASGDTFISIEAVLGSGFNDSLRGAAGADWLEGGAGHDSLQGREGNDSLVGNSGNDTLWGDAGNDQIDGGDGHDSLYGAPGNDTLYGYLGNDTQLGEAGDDRIYAGDGGDSVQGGDGQDYLWGGTTSIDARDTLSGGNGRDTIDAGHGNDLVHGDIDTDSLLGKAGNDDLYGDDGNDTLTGGLGSDRLFGGTGNDQLKGSEGNDSATGGTGADRFFHNGTAGYGSDWIMDFHNADADRLVFGIATALPANFAVTYANQAGRGAANLAEAVVTYRPTGQVIWTIVDGAAETSLMVQINGQTYDLI